LRTPGSSAAGISEPLGVNDEPSWRRANEVEWITGDQRQRGTRRGVQHPEFFWVDDGVARHPISIISPRCREADVITHAYTSERTKERVSMTGQGSVSLLPRKRCIRQMADRDLQRVLVVSLSNDSRESDSRNLETPDRSPKLGRPDDGIRYVIGFGLLDRRNMSLQ
jgi:hypothetical protein